MTGKAKAPKVRNTVGAKNKHNPIHTVRAILIIYRHIAHLQDKIHLLPCGGKKKRRRLYVKNWKYIHRIIQ